jgi:anti-anti-sigma factor
LFDSDGKDLVLDCSGLEYIASSGLRILMNLLKTARTKGERVALKNVNEVIRDVLDMTGFVSYFDFE